jgi:hypothetical protein
LSTRRLPRQYATARMARAGRISMVTPRIEDLRLQIEDLSLTNLQSAIFNLK